MARRGSAAKTASASPTIRDVARRARVSVTTAAKAVTGAGPVSEPTRLRVRAAVLELGYRPVIDVRSRRRIKTKVIGLVMPWISASCSEWLRGASLAAREHGYALAICDGRNSMRTTQAHLERLFDERVDGLLLGGSTPAPKQLAKFVRARIPIGLDITNPNFNRLYRDEGWKPPTMAAFHCLVENGHRRILVCVRMESDEGYVSSMQRYWVRCLEACLAEVGSEYDRDLVRPFCEPAECPPVLRQLLTGRNPPTALVIASDYLAPIVLATVGELGLEIPNELSILAFEVWEAAFRPPLATVEYNCFDVAYGTAKELLLRLEGLPGAGEMSRFPATFARRSSIGPARGPAALHGGPGR